MKIGGFQRFSLIEYPGRMSAIVFTQQCNFKCGYCHNPELVSPELFGEPIPEQEILSFMKTRRGKLDAVTVTGGEPLVQDDLIDFIGKLKGLGFLVKLDTNGSLPDTLKTLIETGSIDYIAMDIKGPPEKLESIAGRGAGGGKVLQSIGMIMKSGIDYEFRTTIVASLLEREDILRIGELIEGAPLYILQKFRSSPKLLDESFLNEATYSDTELQALSKELKDRVLECRVR